MSDSVYEMLSKIGIMGSARLGIFEELNPKNPTTLKVLSAPGGVVDMVQAAYVSEVVGSEGKFTIDFSSDSEKYNFIGPPVIKCFAGGDDNSAFNDRIQVNVDFDSRDENQATGVAFRGPDPTGTSLLYRAAPAGTKIYAMVWATVDK